MYTMAVLGTWGGRQELTLHNLVMDAGMKVL